MRAGILDPRISLAKHSNVTDPAFHVTAHGPDFFPAVAIKALGKWILMRADRSESECYYQEEKTLNQMMPINLFPSFKKKKSNNTDHVIRSVRMGKKLCPWS